MLARLRKTQEENEGGFTLIELLVVMIIIGILAAIAIPVFLNQRKKAQDSAAKADVSTIGKEIATYFVDNTGVPVVSMVGTAPNQRYSLTDASGYGVVAASAGPPAVAATTGADLGKVSSNVTVTSGVTSATATGVDSTHWCIGVTNSQG